MICDTHCSTEVSNLTCTLDLGLVADRTESIKWRNIPKLKEALQLLVQRFDISADKTHVSYLTFARSSKLQNTFNDAAYHSQAAILTLISGSIKNLGRQTRLDRAIKAANEQMFALNNGLRPGVGNTMVLFTDGRTHPTSKDMSGHVAALKVTPLVAADLRGDHILEG